MRLARQDRVLCVHLAPPCGTYTRARRRPIQNTTAEMERASKTCYHFNLRETGRRARKAEGPKPKRIRGRASEDAAVAMAEVLTGDFEEVEKKCAKKRPAACQGSRRMTKTMRDATALAEVLSGER